MLIDYLCLPLSPPIYLLSDDSDSSQNVDLSELDDVVRPTPRYTSTQRVGDSIDFTAFPNYCEATPFVYLLSLHRLELLHFTVGETSVDFTAVAEEVPTSSIIMSLPSTETSSSSFSS